jgi:hypothetical protein
MSRDQWIREFIDELVVLRPHLGEQFARAVGIVSFQSLPGFDPREVAIEYHVRQEQLRTRSQAPRR